MWVKVSFDDVNHDYFSIAIAIFLMTHIDVNFQTALVIFFYQHLMVFDVRL